MDTCWCFANFGNICNLSIVAVHLHFKAVIRVVHNAVDKFLIRTFWKLRLEFINSFHSKKSPAAQLSVRFRQCVVLGGAE